MRKLLIVAAAAFLLVGGVAAYLLLTTPREAASIRFPLSASQTRLLAIVPEPAETFALIPRAAALQRRFEANPLTRGVVARWRASQPLPPPWMIGGADLLIWRVGKTTGYAIRPDAFRALAIRLYLMFREQDRVAWDNGVLVINSAGGPALAAGERDRLLALALPLPAGDALVVQRSRRGGAFPPIGRPAVSTVAVKDRSIEITSRCAREGGEPRGAPLRVRYPRSALMTVAFAAPPRALHDLNRIVQSNVSSLLEQGGAIALYEVDSGTLLPRPREVIVLPATSERRQTLERFLSGIAPQSLRDALGFRIERAESGGELLVAFERATLDRYLGDAFETPALPANSWSMRADPARLAPVLDRLSDNLGLRIAAPRLFRSARDLGRWTGELRNAGSIEAADSLTADAEELRVVITAK